MDQSLRVLFDRALSDEPPAPPGDLTREAMAGGRRLRRRRQVLAGGVAGVVTVLATVVAVNMASTPSPTATAMALATRHGCTQPAQDAVEVAVAVFLDNDITDRQRADLDESLRSDPRVRQVRYESKEQAYEGFKQMYRDAPDLLAAVKPGDLPEAFRLTLAQPEGRLALEQELRRRPGVETVVGSICGKPAGEGE